jgi:uncharacterized protein YcaQ
MPRTTLSLPEARRIALAAQGFARPRPAAVTLAHIRRTIRRLGLLQIDYVNVLGPSHYHVLFSRLGPYPKSHLDDLVYRRREFTEHWAHEASILPVESWPLLRHRMDAHRVRPYGFEKVMACLPEYVAWILDQVRTRGPICAEELPEPEGEDRRMPGAWVTVPRAVLEAHFGRGLLAIADRRPNFARAFDLAERVLAAEHRERKVDPEAAQRQLLAQAARASGVATAADLADYYRMSMREARPRIAELLETGEVTEVKIEGWRDPAYLHREAHLPRRIDAQALLSPFDPVVWFRPRAARLFDFDYRVEIFIPQSQRKWGFYVLPFLLGDRLVGRVDLKADRTNRCLRVLSAHLEPHSDPKAVAPALALELRTLASWLSLESVAVENHGDLAPQLEKAI